MKNFVILCCLGMLMAGSAFADKKPFDQTVTSQQLTQAKQKLELELRINQLEKQIKDSKLTDGESAMLMSEYESLLSQLGRTSRLRDGAIDDSELCNDAAINAPGQLTGNICDSGDDCNLRGSLDVQVVVNIPHDGLWSFAYDGPDYDPYIYIGYECCTNDICENDDGGEGLNSLCPCVYLTQGTVYITLEAFSGCGPFVLTVSECVVGRCCYTNDFGGPSCLTVDLDHCLALGGIWAEGLNCQENPCGPGRCCYLDDGESVCDITGEAFCIYQLGGEWSEGLTCSDACPAPGDCGPIDLVFAVDVTGSMQPAIDNIVAELPNIITIANLASGFDLKLGLVTFTDQVQTLHNLTANLAAVQASIALLTASGGAGLPEASDEALREIITNDAGCTDGSEFTSAFRPAASKIIVLITDASNGGCDDTHDASDIVNAHQRALDAAGLGVRISSVYVPRPGAEPSALILPILNDYAATSAGSVRIVASNGAGTGGAINQILRDCGQGELRLSSNGIDLRCDPNGGGITTPTFDLRVNTLNDGTAECLNAVLEVTNIGGDFGTAVLNSLNPVPLGNIAVNQLIQTDFNFTITPDADGGQMIVTVNLTSDNCPPNFLDIVINVPDCDSCDGEHEIYFFEDDIRIPPACMCAYLCEGQPIHVYVCGEGLTQGHYPILNIASGCRTDDCNEECTPAEFLFSNTGWTLYGDTCWHNLIIPQSDGCVCICFDRFLPVELANFSAIARDGEIQLNWSTASETDNDHFELMRDGLMTAYVAATNNASGSAYTFVDRGLVNGRLYHYELVSISVNGDRAIAGEISSAPQAGAAIVMELSLFQNYPNPFNPETNISFDLVETGNVTLIVYNSVGQEVSALINGTLSAGRHNVVFDASGLTSGLYFYRLTAGETTMQKKMLLLK